MCAYIYIILYSSTTVCTISTDVEYTTGCIITLGVVVFRVYARCVRGRFWLHENGRSESKLSTCLVACIAVHILYRLLSCVICKLELALSARFAVLLSYLS